MLTQVGLLWMMIKKKLFLSLNFPEVLHLASSNSLFCSVFESTSGKNFQGAYPELWNL